MRHERRVPLPEVVSSVAARREEVMTEISVGYHWQGRTAKAIGDTVGARFRVSSGAHGQDGVPEEEARGSLTR